MSENGSKLTIAYQFTTMTTTASVRGAAVGSLSSFKMGGVMEALLPLLSDSDEQVRVDAVTSLGYLGDRRAIPALQAALYDPNERARSFAAYALEQLGKT